MEKKFFVYNMEFLVNFWHLFFGDPHVVHKIFFGNMHVIHKNFGDTRVVHKFFWVIHMMHNNSLERQTE